MDSRIRTSELKGRSQFQQNVFPAELQELRKRRERVLGETIETETETPAPSTRLGLVGLALSGGGIRSATFNLGVLQALSKYGILRLVDYLSTVSGGGFIGACLSCLLNSPHHGPEYERFPFRHEPGKEEPLPFRHLRNNSNYLKAESVWDSLRIPALLLRGLFINFLTFLPYILLAVFITDQIYGTYFRRLSAGQLSPQWNDLLVLTPWALAVFGLWVFLSFVVYRLCMRKFQQDSRARQTYETSFSVVLFFVLIALALDFIPMAFQYYLSITTRENEQVWSVLFILLGAVPFLFADRAAKNVSRWYGQLGLYLFGILGPTLLLFLYFYFADFLICYRGDSPPVRAEYFYFGAVFLFVYIRALMDVNTTSIHNFYRDRLARTFLFRLSPDEQQLEPAEEMRLSQLNSASSSAPYHLINATLNLQGCKNPNLRGRDADFFLFSKHFTGSYHTGYCPTPHMEAMDPKLTLATATAISAAAVSPNSGSTTVKPLVFILTLLNLRLGYWLPNPRKLDKKRKVFFRKVKFEYLLKELFSRIDAESLFVNVSDGGHLENLGIYELLRRRCKLIIVSDASADPHHDFSDLAKAIRMARIDMAIEIDIDLDRLRLSSEQLTENHWAVGTIDYGNGETGYLIYLKSSVTGDEEEYIREYWNKHPRFPHESTADQFFDETQFEVYRALGYHVAKELFSEPEVGEILEQVVLKNADIDLAEALAPNHNWRRTGFQAPED